MRTLVATIGPASWSLAGALRAAGATAFRLNASHLDPAALLEGVRRVRREAPGAPIVVDLQGAKMRLGRFDPLDVKPDERVRFAVDGRRGVPAPHPELIAQTRVGETLSVDDGRLRFRVVSCDAGGLETIAIDAGRVMPRKGVNVVEHPVGLDALTATDSDAIRVAREAGVDCYAFSFMTDGREAGWLRAEAPGCRVVGKVERREAAGSLDAIAADVDEIWICRGDLGAQLGEAALARFVAAVDPARLPVPVLMAGQVLEHLTHHRCPTRSEVCHLFDLLQRGYAGVVLSDESAIGIDPVGAVGTATKLLGQLSGPDHRAAR